MNQNDAARMLRVLADCYLEPTPDLSAGLADLAGRNDPLAEPARGLLDDLAGQDFGELLKDYARLFLGPFTLLAPPFGSVYLDDGRQMMGPSTLDARRIYRQAGLEMSGDFRNPPDHVSAELEFLSWLLVREAGAEDDEARRLGALRREFLANHLGAWADAFAARVEEGAATGFYRGLARLTRKFLEAEATRPAAAPAN